MNKIFHYGVVLMYAFFATGCARETLISVTHLQATETGVTEDYIEITYSSSADAEKDYFKERGLSIQTSVNTYCVDKQGRLQGLEGIRFKDVVGYEDKAPAPEQNGEYLYSIFIPVKSEGSRYRPTLTEQSGYRTYDLMSEPQDICTQIRQEWIAPGYLSGWMVTPKEMIATALALPPDAERSAAYQRELAIDRWSKPVNR